MPFHTLLVIMEMSYVLQFESPLRYMVFVTVVQNLFIILYYIILYYIILYYIIYLTAVGLTPGGSSTVHIYKQTAHRTTQSDRIHRKEQT
jgi:hypothetical protein